jgi:hypothetical protein
VLVLGGGCLSLLVFGPVFLSPRSPAWLQLIAREIQAACRDAGTQWLVMACLVCYFITFLVLGRRLAPLNSQPSTSATPSRHLSRVTRHVFRNPDFWLCAFVLLVLLRYAFDYANAAKSLQVVVLLAGIVIGKGIALWSGWARSRGPKVEGREPAQVGRASPLPAGPDSSSEAVRGNSALNSQPSTLNRALFVLCVLTLLLACASLWHPERGMEFFYRGVKRWTGPWDNPNIFGLLMGVGVVLAVGLVASGIWRRAVTPTCNLQPSTCNFLRRFPSLVTRHLPLVLLVLSAALCAYGLIKSYSRGAWLGTAVGLGFLLWNWLNRELREPHEKPGQEKPATFNFQPATRRLWLPLSVLLASLFVICFWQFRHTEAPVVRRVFSVGNVNDFSWRNRVAAWEGAGRMMMDKPLRGFGWGQAEQVYSKEYRAARLEEAAAIQMNDYLMIGISAGAPALGCLLIYLGLAISRRSSGEGREPEELATFNLQLSTIASSGAVVLLVGFWFDGGMFKLPTTAVFWVLLELARISPLAGLMVGRAVLCPPSDAKNASELIMGGALEAPRPSLNSQPSTLNIFTLLLRWIAGLAATLALVLTALHLITPQLAVTERTLAVARKVLVSAPEQADFEYLAKMYSREIPPPHSRPLATLSPSDGERDGVRGPTPYGGATNSIRANVPLKTLLQHAHLAHYNRTLVNWKLEDELYRDFVLSPEIVLPQLLAPGLATTLAPSDGERAGVRGMTTPSTLSTLNVPRSTDLNWRRELWEYFYPRIRRESTPGAAAEIVRREVREKIALTESPNPETILDMWEQGRASAPGRARLEVAALRAVGIPARLNQSNRAEFWNGTAWVE